MVIYVVMEVRRGEDWAILATTDVNRAEDTRRGDVDRRRVLAMNEGQNYQFVPPPELRVRHDKSRDASGGGAAVTPS